MLSHDLNMPCMVYITELPIPSRESCNIWVFSVTQIEIINSILIKCNPSRHRNVAFGLQGAIFTKENRKITNDTPFESERIIAVEDIFSIGMMVDQHPPMYG